MEARRRALQKKVRQVFIVLRLSRTLSSSYTRAHAAAFGSLSATHTHTATTTQRERRAPFPHQHSSNLHDLDHHHHRCCDPQNSLPVRDLPELRRNNTKNLFLHTTKTYQNLVVSPVAQRKRGPLHAKGLKDLKLVFLFLSAGPVRTLPTSLNALVSRRWRLPFESPSKKTRTACCGVRARGALQHTFAFFSVSLVHTRCLGESNNKSVTKHEQSGRGIERHCCFGGVIASSFTLPSMLAVQRLRHTQRNALVFLEGKCGLSMARIQLRAR